MGAKRKPRGVNEQAGESERGAIFAIAIRHRHFHSLKTRE
jgi:hypothetical protein